MADLWVGCSRLVAQSGRRVLLLMVLVVDALATWVVSAQPVSASVAPAGFQEQPPPGFQEQTVFSGLNLPTNVEFAADGRVFVAEKGGAIKVFDDLADPTPTTFADLSTNVHNAGDRGLLGMALHPQFPAEPWVYVLYTYDAPPGQTAPVWNDDCASVGGTNGGRCIVTGRLSRLQASGNGMVGSEQVLIHDWCQQYSSHSTGDLKFGGDGYLYVSGGDGASYNTTDYGQLGSPANPCGDPPGGTMAPPTAEGGALRSQDVRSLADPTGVDGAVLRVDPVTGAAAPGNPLIGSSNVGARRIVAHGLRNPFRFAIRPGTDEVWVADVGWRDWEEINRVTSPTAAVTNLGWPCYEGTNTGSARQSGYDAANVNLCESLYSGGGGATAPFYSYHHNSKVVSGESCPTGSSSISGAAFYPASGGNYPSSYQGAFFFADYSRDCIWAVLPSSPGGLPVATNRQTFVAAAANPVDLEIGPGNDLYYVDIAGSLRRIRYFPANQPPVAVIGATPTSGEAPLTVNFDATGSYDADPADEGRLRYEWDFTNDGSVDSTAASPTFTYGTAGSHTARLRVIDTVDTDDTVTVTIQAGNDSPTATIDTPSGSLTWKANDAISFSGRATDPQQGDLPGSSLDWKLQLQHCSTFDSCHIHVLREWDGVASGSFVAPDHEYPAYLELVLTATDAQGLTSTRTLRLDPKTVDLTFASNPTGLQLTVGPTAQSAPFTRTVIQGSTNSVSGVTPQTSGGLSYNFAGWSDRGDQTHVVTAPTAATTYTASFVATTGRLPQSDISVLHVDSHDAATGGAATNVVDGNSNSIWHTAWSAVDPDPAHPHEIQLDLGQDHVVTSLYYLPRQIGSNGRIGAYEIYVSTSPTSWGSPVKTGTFSNSLTEQAASFPGKWGRYVRLRALDGAAGGPWTSAAELNVGVANRLAQSGMSVAFVDSQDAATGGAAANVLDGNSSTLWHTAWSAVNPDPPHPHEIQLDLGRLYSTTCLNYLPRQSGVNGRIASYEIYVSVDRTSWGTPVRTGSFTNSAADQLACWVPKTGRYIRLRALDEVNGGPWTSTAELNVTAGLNTAGP